MIFVRPKSDTNYGLNSGLSYDDALNGLGAIRVVDYMSSDAITICGAHKEQLSITGQPENSLQIRFDYKFDAGSIHLNRDQDFCIYNTRSNIDFYATPGVITLSGSRFDNFHIRSMGGIENVRLYDFSSYDDGRYGFAVEQNSGYVEKVEMHRCGATLFQNAGFHVFQATPRDSFSVMRNDCDAEFSKGASCHGFTNYSNSSTKRVRGVLTINSRAKHIGFDEGMNRTFKTEAAGFVNDDYADNCLHDLCESSFNAGHGFQLAHNGNNNIGLHLNSHDNEGYGYTANGGSEDLFYSKSAMNKQGAFIAIANPKYNHYGCDLQ